MKNVLPLVLLSALWQLPVIEMAEEVQLEGWGPLRSRHPEPYIESNKYTTVISGRGICLLHQPPDVLVIVCSAINRYHLRTAIRNTWARNSYSRYRISVAFLLGVNGEGTPGDDVINECHKHQDVIVENFIDTYNNLTIKSLRMIKWVKSNCPNARFLLKSDDDVYINIQNLAAYVATLMQIPYTSDFLVGYKLKKSFVIRKPTHPNYIPYYMYQSNEYPPYLSGVAYMMSVPTAFRLFSSAIQLELFPVEDVHLTDHQAQLNWNANSRVRGHHYQGSPGTSIRVLNKVEDSRTLQPSNFLAVCQTG